MLHSPPNPPPSALRRAHRTLPLLVAGCSLTLTALLLMAAAEPSRLSPAPDSGTTPEASAAGTPSSSASSSEETAAAEASDEQKGEEALEGVGAPLMVPSRTQAPPFASLKPLTRGQDLLARAKRDATGHLVIPGSDGPVQLTIDPDLQEKLTQTLRSYETPYAAIVVMETDTGRVLALAEHAQGNTALRGLPEKAVFPAASIFKIITATALLKQGVRPEDSECFHGGKRRISEKLLADSRSDRDCLSLSTALAKSANVVFAKLTRRKLDAKKLAAAAAAFHFNQPISFPIPTDMSLARFPSDPFALAATGAGFGDVYLSPLHGALIASVVARGGTWVQPYLFEKDVIPSERERVMSEGDAAKLAEMMSETVRIGTARKVFRQRGLGMKVAGKTGSLADRSPYRDYSWFIGFGPRENPKVAVAAVIVNDFKWRVRATWLGREALRLYAEEQGRRMRASR